MFVPEFARWPEFRSRLAAAFTELLSERIRFFRTITRSRTNRGSVPAQAAGLQDSCFVYPAKSASRLIFEVGNLFPIPSYCIAQSVFEWS